MFCVVFFLLPWLYMTFICSIGITSIQYTCINYCIYIYNFNQLGRKRWQIAQPPPWSPSPRRVDGTRLLVEIRKARKARWTTSQIGRYIGFLYPGNFWRDMYDPKWPKEIRFSPSLENPMTLKWSFKSGAQFKQIVATLDPVWSCSKARGPHLVLMACHQ